MKAPTSLVATAILICVATLAAARQQLPPPAGYGILGQAPGAPLLEGYLIDGRPCLPLKKFSSDTGYRSSVSPSGRNVAVIVGTRNAMVLDGKRVVIDGKEISLPVPPLTRNNDVYLPLDFFDQLFPFRFRYDARTKKVSVTSSGKSLTIPVNSLPPESNNPKNAQPARKTP